MAFDQEPPYNVLACSPVSGLFVTSEKTNWLNLTEFLPKPFTMISSVFKEGEDAYVAFEGRGLWRIVDCQKSRIACYFKKVPLAGPKAICALFRADGIPLPGVPVKVRIVDNNVEVVFTVNTDQSGIIRVKKNTKGKVIHITYAGDVTNAPCSVSLIP